MVLFYCQEKIYLLQQQQPNDLKSDPAEPNIIQTNTNIDGVVQVISVEKAQLISARLMRWAVLLMEEFMQQDMQDLIAWDPPIKRALEEIKLELKDATWSSTSIEID